MKTLNQKAWFNKQGTELLRQKQTLVEVNAQLFGADSLEELGQACLEASYYLRCGSMPNEPKPATAGRA